MLWMMVELVFNFCLTMTRRAPVGSNHHLLRRQQQRQQQRSWWMLAIPYLMWPKTSCILTALVYWHPELVWKGGITGGGTFYASSSSSSSSPGVLFAAMWLLSAVLAHLLDDLWRVGKQRWISSLRWIVKWVAVLCMRSLRGSWTFVQHRCSSIRLPLSLSGPRTMNTKSSSTSYEEEDGSSSSIADDDDDDDWREVGHDDDSADDIGDDIDEEEEHDDDLDWKEFVEDGYEPEEIVTVIWPRRSEPKERQGGGRHTPVLLLDREGTTDTAVEYFY